jgi:hypothetical protein
MQALKKAKLVWPEEWASAKNQVLLSDDGVHFWTREMPHPTLPYDEKYYSHKNKHAGVSYEIGVSLSESKIVWFSGPWPAGMGDSTIYTEKGLEAKIPATCAGIADGGYPTKKRVYLSLLINLSMLTHRIQKKSDALRRLLVPAMNR